MGISLEVLQAARAAWRRNKSTAGGLRIGVASSFTSEPLAPYLFSLLESEKIRCKEIVFAPYNQIIQTCLNPDSAFSGEVDLAIFLWRIEDIAPNALERILLEENDSGINAAVAIVSEVLGAITAFHERFNIQTIVSTPPLPYSPRYDSKSQAWGKLISSCHRTVFELVDRSLANRSILVFDLNMLTTFVGLNSIYDWRKWYLYRQPFTEQFWWRVADGLANLLRAANLPRKKCLVVDCDNTIWGGVIGEDEISGICIGDDFPGSAFKDFQRQIALLADTGVFVAIASKNNPEDVWRVFDEHDGMALQRRHISVAKIGWHEKAQSLREIAAELNIGLDSLVFFDDSRIEIEKINALLPEITCVLVPDEPADIPKLLLDRRFFDQARMTQEDRQRIASYRAEVERKALSEATTPEDFRISLQLKLKVGIARAAHVGRVSQLINKTNQFNLTTKRRTEAEVLTLLNDEAYKVFVLDLEDRFGNYGLVGVSVIRFGACVAEVETFLLSCRALGRGVEQAFVGVMIQLLQASEVTMIRGLYIPTAKNKVAEMFYHDLGFTQIEEGVFESVLDNIPKPCPSITIHPL